MQKLTSSGTKQLFPLGNIHGWWSGYFVDAFGTLYSTKVNKTVPQRLWSERSNIGGMPHTGQEMLKNAKDHYTWSAEMDVALKGPAKAPECTKADCPAKVAEGKYALVTEAQPKDAFVLGKMKKPVFSGYTETRATFDKSCGGLRFRFGLGDYEIQTCLNSQYLDAKAIDQVIELLTFAKAELAKNK